MPNSSVIPWTVARKAPLFMGFSRQEYWSGMLLLPPGHLPNSGIRPMFPASPALAGRFFTTESQWKPKLFHLKKKKNFFYSRRRIEDLGLANDNYCHGNIYWLVRRLRAKEEEFLESSSGKLHGLFWFISELQDFPGGSAVKNLPAMQVWVQSLNWVDLLEKEMSTTPVFLPEESHG